MKKNLIICPNCEYNGKRMILGEITPEGYLDVMRFHNGITRVIGTAFEVACGLCKDVIYIKEKRHEGTISRIGVERVFGLQSSQTLGTTGTFSI